MGRSRCVDENTVAELFEGRRRLADDPELEMHIAECADCRALLANVSIAPPEDLGHAPTVAAGEAASGAGFGPDALVTVAEGRYELVREVARGGMGRILEAWDVRHGRKVAIKMLLRAGVEATWRFVREARITARLQHPAIVPLYEAGRWTTGEPFFAMKLVAGRPLSHVIEEQTTLREKLALLPNLIAMTEALAYAHDQRVVHRDLKPSNVLIGAFGETVVIDWGLAKEHGEAADAEGASGSASDEPWHTKQGRAMGTVGYMPPEQARGATVDERADVYALGAVLYNVFAGRSPHSSGSFEESLGLLLAGPPEPLAKLAPELAPDLVTVVEKAMARDPADRYATAREMAADLERFSAGRLVTAHSYSLAALVGRFVRRHRAVVSMATALVLAVGVTAGVSVRRIVMERDRADAHKLEADRQRGVAVTQRDAAEKLVAFLIGELRDRLDALGKLELLAGVGKEVEGYYRTVAPAQDDVDVVALDRRAEALDLLASVEERRRNFEPAETLARAGADMAESAHQRDPRNVEAALLLARARCTLAGILTGADRADDATAEGARAEALGSELTTLAPTDARAWIVAAHAHALVGIERAMHGDLHSARDRASEARLLLSNVGDPRKLDPAWQDQLAATYAGLGSVATATSDWRLCAEMFHTHDDLRRVQLEAGPDHLGRLAALATGLRSFAFAEENLSAHDTAIAAYHESIDTRGQLLAREPQNLTLRYDQAFAFALLCGLERPWYGPGAAEKTCSEGQTLAEGLVATRPDDAKAHDALSRALRARGYVDHVAKRDEAARRAFVAALDQSRRAMERSPTSPYFKAGALESLYGMALADLALGRPDSARSSLQGAITMTEERLTEEPTDMQYVANLAALSVTSGDSERARGERAKAREDYARGIGHFERVVAADASDVDSMLNLAEANLKLGAVESDGVRRAELRARSQAIVAPLLAAGEVSPEWRAALQVAGR